MIAPAWDWPAPDGVLIVLLAAAVLAWLANLRRWVSSYLALSPACRIALPSLIGASVMLGWTLYPFQTTQPLTADAGFAAIVLQADPLRSLLFGWTGHGRAIDPGSLWLVGAKLLGALASLWLFALLRHFDLSETKSLCVVSLIALSPPHLRLMSAEPSYLLFVCLVLSALHCYLSFARHGRTADWFGALLTAAAAAHLFAFYLALPLVVLFFACLFRFKESLEPDGAVAHREAGPLLFSLSLAFLVIYGGAVAGSAALPRVIAAPAGPQASWGSADMLFSHGLVHPFLPVFILAGLVSLARCDGARRLTLASLGLVPAVYLALAQAGPAGSMEDTLAAYGLVLPQGYLLTAAGMASLGRWLSLSDRGAAWSGGVIAFILVHYQILSQVMVAK